MFDELYNTALSRFGTGGSSTSMGDWICANTTIKKRPFSFEDYHFQKAIADDMHTDMSVIKCSQVGLALALDTPLATPTGWTTMGEVQVGDFVYDEEGQPTRVDYVSPIYTDHKCYQLTFDDGETIVADENHRWYVESIKPFNEKGLWGNYGAPPKSGGYAKSGVLTTNVIAEQVRHNNRPVYRIPTCGKLQAPQVDLPVDSYLLGLWLSDGSLSEVRLASSAVDAEFYGAELSRKGYQVQSFLIDGTTDVYLRVYDAQQNNFGTGYKHILARTLRGMGLIGGAKFIPKQYLRSHPDQRLDLLRGLMDGDGCIDRRGNAIFVNCNLQLIQDFQELAHSLGIKTHLTRQEAGQRTFSNVSGSRRCSATFRVSFTAYSSDSPVLLPRKRERLISATSHSSKVTHRRIISVEPIATTPVRCISVASPNHLFLAGKAMVPTHNTEVQLRKYLAVLARGEPKVGIFSLPNEKLQTRIYNARLKPILTSDQIFNPPTNDQPVRRRDLIQIRDSFGYITGCSEGDATSTSADFLMHDEWDLSDQTMLALYSSRIQNSDMQMTQRFSTPSLEGFGIDRFYSITDQREYFVRCDGCNHWQVPSFTPRFIHVGKDCNWELESYESLTVEQISVQDFSESYVKCEHCHTRLDLGNPDKREWVAKYPGRANARGYQVRPFSTSRLHPDYIFGRLLHYRREGFLRGFYNTVLGEPYTSSSAKIQRADIEACMAKGTPGIPEFPADTPVYLGVDIGMTCHLTLSIDTPDGLPHFIHFEHFHVSALAYKVADLCRVFNIVQGAADRFPYTTDVNSLRDQTQRLIMPVQYRGQGTIAPVKDELGTIDHYSANRTSILDRIHSLIGYQSMILSGYEADQETLLVHLSDMVRDERPDTEANWKKTSGNDHYFHAMGLSLLSRRICEHMFQADNTQIHTSSTLIVPHGRTEVKAMLPMSRRRTA